MIANSFEGRIKKKQEETGTRSQNYAVDSSSSSSSADVDGATVMTVDDDTDDDDSDDVSDATAAEDDVQFPVIQASNFTSWSDVAL